LTFWGGLTVAGVLGLIWAAETDGEETTATMLGLWQHQPRSAEL
jgi:hypothetical protein